MTDLLYSDVEEQLRASVRDLLTDRAPWPAVLARTEADEPYDPALWRTLAGDLGVAGLAVPESLGGHGASWRESAIVAEELGRSVAGTPFLGSVLATALAAEIRNDDLLGRLATTVTTATVAVDIATAPGAGFPSTATLRDGVLHGTVRNVVDSGRPDSHLVEALLVPALDGARPVIVEIDADAAIGLTRGAVASFDLTRPLADLTFEATPARIVAAGADAERALASSLVTGAALLASEQLGLAERCLELTLNHLTTRYQFGRQIGSYQALKHRTADMWAGITQARAVARYAAVCIADGDPDAAVAASLAQAYCSPVAVRAAEECVQLHGGIGFTWEHPAHLFLKRAKANAIALGTASAHRARLATLVDLPAA